MLGSHDVGKSIKSLFETLQEISLDTERVAREVGKEMRHQSPDGDIYYRFNVSDGLQNVGLEEWKHMGRIQTVTERHLEGCENQVLACASQIISVNRT